MEPEKCYLIDVRKKAVKALELLEKSHPSSLKRAWQQLSQNPYAGPNISRLEEMGAGYRYRIGDYRILYNIEEEIITVVIISVNRRGEAYKKHNQK